MLAIRVLTAAVLFAALGAVLFLAGPDEWLWLCLLWVILAAREWSALCGHGRFAQACYALSVGAASYFSVVGLPSNAINMFHVVSIVAWIGVVPLCLGRNALPTSRCVLAALGALFLCSAMLALIDLRHAGPWVLLYALGVIWVSDSTAYFSGSWFGRNKLAPLISPGKTWEGVYGALAGVLIYVMVWKTFAPQVFPEYFKNGIEGIVAMMVIALLFTILGIVGDLFESLLKRKAGVKDSGRLLPGHGGVLDRVDALLPMLPVAALVYG